MRKFVAISLFASAALSASEPVELFGGQVDVNGSTATVTGHPVAVYADQVLSADHIRYDKEGAKIFAEGEVSVGKGLRYHLLSDLYRIDLNTQEHFAKPYYLFDQEEGAWISAEEAQGCKARVDLEGGMVSGCDSSDPLWAFRFSSGNYDSDRMWVNLYNARLELGGVPVFYLPYFGYPTDRSRRSGLLMPYFGLSNTQGFFYLQPIYIAPQNGWDLELRPQIRTSRGSGIYADLRFVDTPSSKGEISAGYFAEQRDYAQEYNLANQKHYGYGLHYEHTAPLQEWFDFKGKGQSGLYVNGLWMNDVDYLNLRHANQLLNTTSKQILSRINGFYNTETDYLGVYVKHYQYLDLPSNAQTIQTLPSLQYHRYPRSLFDDRLLLQGDATATHFYRQDGKKAIQGDVNIPLTFRTSLLDDALEASYTANLSAKGIAFYGDLRSDETTGEYEKGTYAQLDHTFALSSTLLRPYGETVHVLSPYVSYTASGSRHFSGYYNTYRDSCDPQSAGYAGIACDYFGLVKPSDTLSLGLNNYLVSDGKQSVMDRVSQNFRYDSVGSYYGELQNELEWEISEAVSFYNKTAYNHDRNRITKEQNTLRYNTGAITAGVSHYYLDELRNDVPTYAYWTANGAYQYSPNLRFTGSVAYDYREDRLKRAEIGFLHTRRCMDFGLRFIRNVRPIRTLTEIGSVDESYVFITIVFKPMGGSEFHYRVSGNEGR